MSTEGVKEQLIQATRRLLENGDDAKKITARQIAAEAGTTLGMINYYFDSRDALVNTAVNTLITDRATQLQEIKNKNIPASEKLLEFLIKVSDTMIEYKHYTKPTIPYCLLDADLDEPYYILPLVKGCFPMKSETECRIIAYQLTSLPQLMFYRSIDFNKYTGVDIMDREQREELFRTLINLYSTESS